MQWLVWAIMTASMAFAGRQAIVGGRASDVRLTIARPDTLARWDLVGSGTWTTANGLLILQKAGSPLPAGSIRRPAALAILRTPSLAGARLDVQLRCTAPVDVIHRDLEIVFGYESPTRFYYVHLAGTTDDVHNGVFLVDNADRRRIDAGTTPAQLKDQAWHHVRLDWQAKTGRILIHVDDAAAPTFDVTDRTIQSGRVGLGSFDDTGEFRAIRVIGNR